MGVSLDMPFPLHSLLTRFLPPALTLPFIHSKAWLWESAGVLVPVPSLASWVSLGNYKPH